MCIDKFSANQVEAIELLAIGKTHAQIAKKLDISVYTVDKWRQNPLFNLEVKRLVKIGYESAVEEMALLGAEAVAELREIIKNADTRTRDKLDAIKLVFSVCDNLRDWTDKDIVKQRHNNLV